MKPNKRPAVFEIKKLLCDIFVLSLHNADDCAAYHCPSMKTVETMAMLNLIWELSLEHCPTHPSKSSLFFVINFTI